MKHQIEKIDRNTNKSKDIIIVSGSYQEAKKIVSKKNEKLKTDRYYWTITLINI